MNSRKVIPVLTMVLVISFAGLMAVQAIWIKKVIEANQTLFRSRVEVVLKDAAQSFRQQSIHTENLSYAVNTNTSQTLTAIKSELNNHIKTSLDKVALNLPFEFAVYAHEDNGGDNLLRYKFGSYKICETLPICLQTFDRQSQSYQVPLTCSVVPDNPFHLAVILPTQNRHLLATLFNSLLASLVFTIALISLFIYFLYMVYRQKKLATIKDDFINNLTHEFKTPLFSIGLAAGLLKKNEEIQEQQQLTKYVSLIETEKARLESQVNKILQMAMVDSGNFVLEKRRVDIHQLIESVVHDFVLPLEEKGGAIHTSLHAEKHMIEVDEVHMKNVLFNILDNALKYNNRAPMLLIDTTTANDNGKVYVVVSITDNGIGMDKEVQKNIFSKFYRAYSGDVHNVKGFGLGMSYVKSIVEAHKGSIRVVSTPGKGSTFLIKLPA